MTRRYRNYNLSYCQLQLPLLNLLLLLNFNFLQYVGGENLIKFDDYKQLGQYFKDETYFKANNYNNNNDNTNIEENDDILSDLKRPHRSLLLGKLFQNDLFGKTFEQKFKSYDKNNMKTKCHKCNTNAADLTGKNCNNEQNLYNLIKNFTYNPWKYDNKDEKQIKYPPILYRPIIHISQAAQQQPQPQQQQQQQQKQLYEIKQQDECMIKSTSWPYPLECFLNRKGIPQYSMPQLNLITPSSGKTAYLIYETPKSHSFILHILPQYPYHYYAPMQLTMNDQPYRDCPELFTEYKRRLKQDYVKY